MQQFSIKEYEDASRKMAIISHIKEVIGDSKVADETRILLSLAYDYAKENSFVILKAEGDNFKLYLTSAKNYGEYPYSSVLVTARPGFLQFSQAYYKGIGNGINQEGLVHSRAWVKQMVEGKEWIPFVLSFDISINDLELSQASLTYSYSERGDKGSITMPVDSKNLKVLGDEDEHYFDDEFYECAFTTALSLLQKAHLKDKNVINGEKVTYEDEDLTTFEAQETNKYGASKELTIYLQ